MGGIYSVFVKKLIADSQKTVTEEKNTLLVQYINKP